MTATTTAGPETHDETAALDTVADMLAARRLGTRTMRVLKITGRHAAATADLAIGPRRNSRLVLPRLRRHTARRHQGHSHRRHLLHATDPPDPPERPRPDWGSWLIPNLDFLAKTAALAVTSYALTAAFGHHSLDRFTIPDMTTISSPGRPGRGTVRVTADGTISWHTRVHGHPRAPTGSASPTSPAPSPSPSPPPRPCPTRPALATSPTFAWAGIQWTCAWLPGSSAWTVSAPGSIGSPEGRARICRASSLAWARSPRRRAFHRRVASRPYSRSGLRRLPLVCCGMSSLSA